MSEPVAIHPTAEELEAVCDELRQPPREVGTIVRIVRRPATNRRETLQEGRLLVGNGLEGDVWNPSGKAPAEIQLTLMNSRVIRAVARTDDRWELAGDQLFVDLDLSTENLPPGARLFVGTDGAEIEVAAEPHTGCSKFRKRFGTQALRFVNSPEGRQRNWRGIYAMVIRGGIVRVGDRIEKIVFE